jgi:succinyl-CoA synthetase beta subunit
MQPFETFVVGSLPRPRWVQEVVEDRREGRLDAGEAGRLRAIAAAARSVRSGEVARGFAGDGWVDEVEAKELLRRAGIAVPEGRVVASEDDCATAIAELGGPVALKLASTGLRHKSASDALRLDVRTDEEARAAYRELAASSAAAGARVLVELMAPPGVELLIAARTDAVVPALVLGLGGIWVEALDDVVVVALPADAERCKAAILSLRGAGALVGGRGGERVDLGAAASVAAAVGSLAIEAGLDLLELNPLVVHREGCVALDALGRRRPSRRGSPSVG